MTRALASPIDADSLPLGGYFSQSQLPLASLLLLLPLMSLYELAYRFALAGGNLIAFRLMREFYEFFGVSGHYLPPITLFTILLTWHIARHDPWRVSGSCLPLMILESFTLALPLLLLSRLLSSHLLIGISAPIPGVVLSLGAGIYEELVFRLVGITALNLLLMDILQLRRSVGVPLAVSASAVLFALYHYLGAESFLWSTFLFRTFAGLYFGFIFTQRGFGITALCHSSYDIMAVLGLAVLEPHS